MRLHAVQPHHQVGGGNSLSNSSFTTPGTTDRTTVFRRLILTTSTVLWLWGAYALYSSTISPHLQPPPDTYRLEALALSEDFGEQISDADGALARKYLHDAHWIDPPDGAPDDLQPFQIQVGTQLKIFTIKIESLPAGRELRFRPFAMLITPENSSQKESPEPVAIIAEEAVIKFANSIDLNSPPGRIVSGQFKGKATLRGPDNLCFVGDTFFFDEQIQSQSSILYSDSLVKFTYGPHSGQGIQFNVEFTRLKGDIPEDLPAIAGVEKIWINRDVHLELVDTREVEQKPPSGHAVPRRGEMVIVDAQGRMTLDMRQNRLTLEDQVRLVHPDNHGKQDSVDCELLVLELINPDAGIRPPAAAKDDRFSNWFPRRLELGSLTATGNPEKLVRINSPQYELWGDMRSLQYDVRNRRAILLEEKRDGVHIVQSSYDIRSPEIHIHHGPDYEPLTVDCLRPGRLVSRGNQSSPFHAEWQEKMSKHPSSDVPGEDVVELHGKARLAQPLEKMSLTAEHLFAGFTLPSQSKVNNPGGSDSNNSSERNQTETSFRRPNLPPKPELGKSGTPSLRKVILHWINAQEKVRLVHPKVVGNTHRLAVNFEDSPTPLPLEDGTSFSNTSTQTQSASREQKKKNDSPRTDSPQSDSPSELTAANNSPVAEKSPPPPSPEDLPPELTAGELQVTVLQHGDQRRVTEVKGLRRFEMHQQHNNGADPLHVQGEWVQLLNPPERDQELILHGQPAILKDQGNTLTGPLIKVLRQKNYAEVIGPGSFSGPVNSSLDGKQLDHVQKLTVNWREKVTFNGQKITFFDRVMCELDDSSMSCPEMIVELSEHLSFIDLDAKSSRKKAPDIRLLECKHQVVFEQNSYEGDLHSLRAVGNVTNFTADRQTGKTIASGPGTLRVWRRKTPGSKSPAPATLVQTNHNRNTEPDPREWEFQEVRFRKQMQGNYTQKFTVFEGPVQVIYGPVLLPTELIPLENLPTDGGTMDCNELQITQEGNSDSQNFNLLGKGNVRIEGFGFNALADEINHDQSKGQYKLRGHGRNLVNLWYRDLESGQDKRAAGESFDFRVVDGAVKELKGHRTSVIDGTD